MDPNAALAEIRDLVNRINTDVDRWTDGASDEPDVTLSIAYAATDLAERVAALDGWMTRGGFTPDDWRAGPA